MNRKHIIGNRRSGKSLSILKSAEENKSIVLVQNMIQKRHLEELSKRFDIDVKIISMNEKNSLRGQNLEEYRDSQGFIKFVIDESMLILTNLISENFKVPSRIVSVSDTGNIEVRAGVYKGKENELDTTDDIAVLNISLGDEEEWQKELDY